MKGWYGNKYNHSLASRGIKSIQKKRNDEWDFDFLVRRSTKELNEDIKDIEMFPDEITDNDILIMIDVDETAMDKLDFPESVKENYIDFVEKLKEKTNKRIHGITPSDTFLNDWNDKNWDVVGWSEDYQCGLVSEELVEKIKKYYDNNNRIIVFGIYYDDCVRKTTANLSYFFPNVYRWKNYSIGEEFGTYYSGD